MTVRIARGHVEVVEYLASLDELGRNLDWKLTQKFGYDMPPGFLPPVEVERLEPPSPLTGGSRNRPTRVSLALGTLGVGEIPIGLGEPVLRSNSQLDPPESKCHETQG